MTARPAKNTVRPIGEHECEALDQDYREHAAWLRAAARRRTGGAHFADDLVQEAFLRVARYPVEERRTSRPLLLRILANLITDRFRSSKRDALGLFALHEEAKHRGVHVSDPCELLTLRAIILAMPTNMREVFVLARFTPLTQPEIAARLGISVKTVEWRLARALEYCAGELAE